MTINEGETPIPVFQFAYDVEHAARLLDAYNAFARACAEAFKPIVEACNRAMRMIADLFDLTPRQLGRHDRHHPLPLRVYGIDGHAYHARQRHRRRRRH